MTSGKTTLGKIVANVLGWDFIDLDQAIIEQEGMSIHEIFEKKGEAYFREIEQKKLREVAKKNHVIVSLGGGTLNSDETAKFLNEQGITVYLKVEPENLYQRLKNKIDRPIFRDLVLSDNPSKEEFLNRINELLSKREKYYNQAQIIISSDSQRVGKTVDILAAKLRRLIDA
jgi:shikimate kinase